MKQRYRLFKLGWGTYHFQDVETGRQESLKTRDKNQARTPVHTMNEAVRQPMLNLDIARAYLKGSDSGFNSRTWAWVMEKAGEGKQGATKERWLRGVAEKPFDEIRNLKLTETKAEHLLTVLKVGTVSTNIFLRRLHIAPGFEDYLTGLGNDLKQDIFGLPKNNISSLFERSLYSSALSPTVLLSWFETNLRG